MMNYNGEAPYNKRMRTGPESKDGPYSFNDYIYGPKRGGFKRVEEKPNHIILITVINPAYPITVEVLHTICKTYGNVLRMVIFKKNGIQAMVEYDGIDTASRAREGLQGADIYSGCCTLKIEYAKPEKLNVHRNDTNTWDFTVPDVAEGYEKEDIGGPSQSRAPLLQDPIYPGGPAEGGPLGGGPRMGNGLQGRIGSVGSGPSSMYHGGPPPDRTFRYGASSGVSGPLGRDDMGPPPFRGGPTSMSGMGAPPGPMGGGPQSPVLMVYGLNKDRLNCGKLFNILCLYGNVVRVKFLKSKEGCAMVQMGDTLAVERALENLNNITFFDSKMQLGFSKQPYLSEVPMPFNLPDGSSSYTDYTGNKNNRYMNPAMAAKNRITPVGKVLHFFNTPPNITVEVLQNVFSELNITPPTSIKLFPQKSDRSSSGLMDFDAVNEAMEALATANHSEISCEDSRFPYVMKLCFSSTRVGG